MHFKRKKLYIRKYYEKDPCKFGALYYIVKACGKINAGRQVCNYMHRYITLMVRDFSLKDHIELNFSYTLKSAPTF